MNDVADLFRMPQGYVTADSVLHAYIPDYQGNIVGVVNTATDSLEQMTDYYPYGLPHADASNPMANRYKYGSKEFYADLGLNTSDFEARYFTPAFPSFNQPDPLAEKYYLLSPYAYCACNPINLIDPTGEEVTVYATNLPASKSILSKATHTFITVTDANGKLRGYYAFGATREGVPTVFGLGGQLQRRFYRQDREVYSGKDTQHLKAKISVPVPDGMTQEEFDQQVIDVAESFGNNSEIEYSFAPTDLTEGNCNSSTSTILLKAGVSAEVVEEIDNQIPDWSWGFSTTPKPWTKEEQENAVKIQRELDIINRIIFKF